MALVSVKFEFEYTARDGRLVSIKPHESFLLLSKTNEHWWHVRRDRHSRPFYVPARYVKELAAGAARDAAKTDRPPAPRNTLRFSTFGFCDHAPEAEPTQRDDGNLDVATTESPTGRRSLAAAPLNDEGPQLYARPKVKDELKTSQRTQTVNDQQDADFPPPPPPAYDVVPEINVTPSDDFPELPDCADLPDPPAAALPSPDGTAEPASKRTASEEQVDNEGLQSAVYVNVAQLRASVSESPPSAASPFSPSYLDPEGWEVHVDQESGQEYYYHAATGRTTWDNPFLDSPVDPEPAEDPCSPSPPQSPAFSQSTASPSAWASDWEQLVDESSGRPYFYNPMSGETSWEPPEQPSPYTPHMEPMSVHRFHEDGPPPLPAEDYPAEDYPSAEPPEPYEELLATGPPTLPKEYTFSQVGRTIIPRANLDRSTPAGWNLTVEPSGMWVFTSESSPDQWIKSVDERGRTYYYSRDGSKSQWSLPEAAVGLGQHQEENGVEPENPSIIKNWRHSVGPLQFGSAQDDARFVPTHRRNTSDYSSDSSSTGNSPESQHNAFGFRPWRRPYYLTSRWLRYNVQNLEKAGILNKTKVCENGKKVRKNWTQTWTVLHGGVLTFHKDPKSAATGASNKTNQIVPEVAVDLRGATIGWASKEKSSKKNVLELKGKNGVEFLIQYDTESIISDWHKVLVDTIRQLEYQELHHSEDEDGDFYEKVGSSEREEKLLMDKRRVSRMSVTSTASTVTVTAAETDPKRVRTKLMKFLLKRPTLQSVKEKGYIRDNVFGCHLATLCASEKSTVPSFVEKCIRAVETRGLDIDGLYRVSGNLAVIQKLRFKADHEELDLEDGQWEDVHVITGALKLFFRELQEPLFPYSHFNKFISAIRIPDHNTKLSHVDELVRSLPAPNHDTMERLFGHLFRVIQHGDSNRMTSQNVAIVFGPTLLRPETESSNIAIHMVYQNQIVEFILKEYERIFLSG